MSKIKKFKSFSRSVFEAASFALEHKETITDLIKENFSQDVVNYIQNEKFLITELAIWNVVHRIDADKKNIQSLQCFANGIELTVHGKVAGAASESVVPLRILELVIAEDKQEVVLEIGEEQVSGYNLWGKVVFGIAGLFVKSFSRHALEQSTWADKLSFSKDGKTVRVSLAELPAVQKLCEQKLVNWKDSVPLRLISVKGASHVKDGVVVELEVAEKIKNATGLIANAKTKLAKSFELLSEAKNSLPKKTRLSIICLD